MVDAAYRDSEGRNVGPGGRPIAPPLPPAPPASPRKMSTPRHAAGLPRALPNARSFVGAMLCVAAALVAWYAASGRADVPKRPLVTAGRDISAGLIITLADVKTQSVEVRPELRIRTFGDASDVVGRVALGPIAAGDPILRSAAGPDGSDSQRRQVSFTMPIAAAVGGTIRSGDTVDILATVSSETGTDLTRTFARNVLVSQVTGNDTSVVTTNGDRMVTLSIEASVDAEALVNAAATGKIHLVKTTGTTETLISDAATATTIATTIATTTPTTTAAP